MLFWWLLPTINGLILMVNFPEKRTASLHYRKCVWQYDFDFFLHFGGFRANFEVATATVGVSDLLQPWVTSFPPYPSLPGLPEVEAQRGAKTVRGKSGGEFNRRFLSAECERWIWVWGFFKGSSIRTNDMKFVDLWFLRAEKPKFH